MSDNSTTQSKSKYTLTDIFNLYMDDYLKNHTIPLHYHKAINDIINCGTGYFGYTISICDNCKKIEQSNNTCGNRHCPSCQGIKQYNWIQTQLERMLPVPYYHVVFTIPAMLNDLCRHNEKLMYDLLFSCSAETLNQFGREKRWLGAEIGFYGILHTWGQKNWIHPHVHYVVPGGGLVGDDWKDLKYKGKFLFPIRALSIVFRGKFVEGLKKLYYNSELTIPETMNIPNRQEFEKYIDLLVARNWIVYSKAPFKTPEAVIKYIGYYTHRIALSNNRIKSIEDGHVTISYKDYKDNKKEKELRLSSEDFIDRFLFHILPPNFHKIRYYGILANGNKNKLEKVNKSLSERKQKEDFNKNVSEDTENEYIRKCENCMKGIMVWVLIVHRFFIVKRTINSQLKPGTRNINLNNRH